jgi:hypothetical protein
VLDYGAVADVFVGWGLVVTAGAVDQGFEDGILLTGEEGVLVGFRVEPGGRDENGADEQ